MKDELLASKILSSLIDHEGVRDDVYTDTTGHRTIGIGHNLDGSGLCYEAMIVQLMHDMSVAEEMLEVIFTEENGTLRFHRFPMNVRMVLMDMMFNLGATKFQGFKKMIGHAFAGYWAGMKAEMLDSLWATQVQKSRVDHLTALLDEEIGEVDDE